MLTTVDWLDILVCSISGLEGSCGRSIHLSNKRKDKYIPVQ